MAETGEKHAVKKDPRRRHRAVWHWARPLARLIAWLRLGFLGEPARVSGPFLLVSNHVTDWDPVLAGTSFADNIYFVASEHILRSRFGKLIAWLQAPIPRQKGGGAAGTVLSMMRHLRDGDSVGVFPEGNRSWDGLPSPFPPAIGKLARTSGARLVTYRLSGGYFTSPRWAGASIRRGRMRGRVVNVYEPEALRAMTPAQINEHIRADLREDAYEEQRKDPVVFRGRRTAEHLERLLFICPACGRTHTLQSKNDTVRCWQCGFTFRYLPTGFLSGKDLPYDNIRDWNAWQTGEIHRLCDEASEDQPIFIDTDMRTDRVLSARGEQAVARGEMKLFKDRLEIPGVIIPLTALSGIALVGPQDLYLSTGEENYLVRSSFTRCMVKYITACTRLTGVDYGV